MRLPVFDFALEIDRQIAALTREQYHLRTGTAKRLIEELYPLSRLGLRLKYPGNTTEVEAFEDSGPVDGAIYWNADSTSQLKVEVTYVDSYEGALRRELLWTEGSTPVKGSIYRERKTGRIIAENAIVPTHDDVRALASEILGLFKKKRSKRYPKGTLLLIAFDDPTFWGSDLWFQLSSAIESQGGFEGAFGDIEIFNCGSNEMLAV